MRVNNYNLHGKRDSNQELDFNFEKITQESATNRTAAKRLASTKPIKTKQPKKVHSWGLNKQ